MVLYLWLNGRGGNALSTQTVLEEHGQLKTDTPISYLPHFTEEEQEDEDLQHHRDGVADQPGQQVEILLLVDGEYGGAGVEEEGEVGEDGQTVVEVELVRGEAGGVEDTAVHHQVTRHDRDHVGHRVDLSAGRNESTRTLFSDYLIYSGSVLAAILPLSSF